jgi:hypothetical protein
MLEISVNKLGTLRIMKHYSAFALTYVMKHFSLQLSQLSWYDTIYLLTEIELTPGGSSTVHIYIYILKNTQKQHNETEYLDWNIHNNKNT